MISLKNNRFPLAIDIRAIIVLLLGMLSFTTAVINPPWDLLGYMTHALNIINGNGYSYVDGQAVLFRGPVFSLLIALSFKMFGVSPESAFHVVRLFSIANPVLIYLFGKKLFNKDIGFVAAILILTSYSMSFWSYRHLDAVWPFFAILHCVFLYDGFERQKKISFVFAGVSLGIAYLTKEVALLFFALAPLMFLWIREYRTKQGLRYIILFFLSLASTLSPWAFYLWLHDGLHFLWGTGGPRVLEDMVVGGQSSRHVLTLILQAAEQYWTALVSFYTAESTNTLAANFVIAPLFLFSWLFIAYKALSGDKRTKILVLNIILFLPIIYFIGKNHWRFGQVLHTMLISYIALSFMLFSILEWSCKLLNRSRITVQVVFCVFATALYSIQVLALSKFDLGYKHFFKKSLCYYLINGKKTKVQVKGEYSNPYLEEVLEKLNEISGFEDGVLVNFKDNARIVFLKTGGTRDVDAVPYVICNENNTSALERTASVDNDTVIVLWSFFKPSDSRFSIYLVFQKQLDKLIKEKNIKYILLSPRYPVYRHYFSSSSRFEQLFVAGPKDKDNKSYFLYRVKGTYRQEELLPVFATQQLRNSLKIMKKEMPGKYRSFSRALQSDFIGLTPEDIEMIFKD